MILVHVGSGKKYKKCCMNKKEMQIKTPADFYIEKSLQEYPKEELKKFYDEETILIDEKLYQALKHKAVPLWVERNYKEEIRRDLKNMKEAIELIKEKCKKEKINTVEEFNNKISIHYSIGEIMDGYLRILDKQKSENNEEAQEQKIDFLVEMMKLFGFSEDSKKEFIADYLEEESYTDSRKALKIFKEKLPELSDYLEKK